MKSQEEYDKDIERLVWAVKEYVNLHWRGKNTPLTQVGIELLSSIQPWMPKKPRIGKLVESGCGVNLISIDTDAIELTPEVIEALIDAGIDIAQK